MPCHRSASGTRPTRRTARPRGDNWHGSRHQGCNFCHPKRTDTRSGKNCFSFGIDIFYRGHRGHAVNKWSKLLLLLRNSVPGDSRGQKLSTGDTGDKIALSTGVNPNKCRQFALLATMLSTGWPKLGFSVPAFFSVETPQKSPKVAIPATTSRTLRRAARPTGQGVAAPEQQTAAQPWPPARQHAQHGNPGLRTACHQRRAVHRAGSGARAAERYPLAQGCTPGRPTDAPAQRKTRRGAGLVGGRGNGYDSPAG